MDQTIAKHLLIEGGTFVVLDVPEGTEFGIDMKVWNTGQNFRGVKMIPPGIHYIHYSAVDEYGETAPKIGFFYNFKRSEFVVKHWDKNLEEISLEQVEEDKVVGLKDNIAALDKFLGAYPYDIWRKWVLLSSHISENLIKKLTPESGQVRSALDLLSCSNADRPRNVEKKSNTSRRISGKLEDIEKELLPDLKPLDGTELRLTVFPKHNYPEGSSPAEITRHSLDSSFVLESIMTDHAREADLLGELQFSYICFLVGHSLEAFEHWKKLVSLLCSCRTAVTKYYTLYDVFISTLEAQIIETPEDFLADIVSNNNIIYLKLRDFFRTVQEINLDGRLKSKIERFKQNLTDRYEWDFSHLDSDEEDEAPVIVEI